MKSHPCALVVLGLAIPRTLAGRYIDGIYVENPGGFRTADMHVVEARQHAPQHAPGWQRNYNRESDHHLSSAVDEPSRDQQFQRVNRQGSSADMDILPDGPFSGDSGYRRTRENRLTDKDEGWQDTLPLEGSSEPVFRDAHGGHRGGDVGHFDEAKPLKDPNQFHDPNGARELQKVCVEPLYRVRALGITATL